MERGGVDDVFFGRKGLEYCIVILGNGFILRLGFVDCEEERACLDCLSDVLPTGEGFLP